MKKLVLMMMAVVFSLASFAQQGGQRREFSPESMATRRADQVKEAAQLNDEQYKKVYELFLKQAQETQAKMKEAQEKGERPQFNREEMQKQQEKIAGERRSQVGTGDRSERIRTYNFPQGRISDHRSGVTLYKLDNFLNGDMDEIIDGLITMDQAEKMKNF